MKKSGGDGHDKMLIRLLFLTLILVWIIGPNTPGLAIPTQDEKAKKLPIVFVETAKKTEIYDLLTYPARVVSKVDAAVLAEGEGVVTEIHAPLGTPVFKNQKIATITHTDPVYQYAPQTLVSPVNGVVSGVEVTLGSRVTKGQKLASVTDPRKLRALIEVAAIDLTAIQKGTQGLLRVAAAGDEEAMRVRVKGVSPFVDPATGTATVEVEILEQKPFLRPGLVGQAQFKANIHAGILVPVDSVTYKNKQSHIKFVKDGKAVYAPVKTGKTQNGFTEILEGLEENAKVITRESKYVGEGQAVQVEQAEAPSAHTRS